MPLREDVRRTSEPRSFYARHGKRWLDVAGAFAGLLILSPLFVVIAIAVKLSSSGPAFFRQIRVGRYGIPFWILKFRSMRVEKNVGASLLTSAGDPRITRVGRFLRKTKLDELPQLVNVFLGDMSLIGPRPEVPEYVAAYSGSQRRILLARPGITGIATMNSVREEELLAAQQNKDDFYRQVLLPAKLRVDIAYCENIQLREDLKIIFQTFFRIFRRPAGSVISLPQLPESET